MRWIVSAAAMVLTLSAGAVGQERGKIVEDAVNAAEAERQRDAGKVERMSEEAAAAVAGAPSGAEAIGSTAPPATALLADSSGLSLRRLIDAPLHDRDGGEVGTIRDVLLRSDGGAGVILVALADGSVRGLNAARVAPIEGAAGYRTDLAQDGLASLPGYREEGGSWQMAE